MPLVRYEPDLEAWKHHFKTSESDKKIVPLKTFNRGTGGNNDQIQVKLVTPTEQSVQQAKELVKKEVKQTKKRKSPF